MPVLKFYHMYRWILLIILPILPQLAFSQVSNDECNGAVMLTQLNNWCSATAAYTTVGASESTEALPSCFPANAESNDVWFVFQAVANTVNISINGNTGGAINGGTLQNPGLALYSGSCSTGLVEEECISDALGNNTIETFGGPLMIGALYYIRVDARNANVGTFQLCINNFNQIPEPSSDCSDGVILCDQSPFTVQSVVGPGTDTDEIDPSSCVQVEISSVWYKWTCDQPGSLTFTLTPNQATDDLDFALYELPNGIDDCSDKNLIRCMASGENVGEPFPNWEPCTGATGLSAADTDTEEFPGCASGDNNFVSAVDMQAGVSYALVVNNFSNTGSGFSVEWGGTGTFLGPVADFEITPNINVVCEEELSIIDASIDNAGNVVGWNWNFGAGAVPQIANTQGPHAVEYESVGTKFIVLTIESSAGCIVTEVIELEVEACCPAQFDLNINLEEAIDPNCTGEASGSIRVSTTGTNGPFEYSLDGNNFSGLNTFNGLEAGTYTVWVRDTKGCLDSLDVTLIDPSPIFIEASPDVVVELGNTTDLFATTSPLGTQFSISWTPDSLLNCSNCLDPTALPPTTTTFVVTATDEDGCMVSDEVTVTVNVNRPIYIPNSFSPNGDGDNDTFILYGGPSARQIQVLRIFNRWGALVYEGKDILLGDESRGWDGRFKGDYVNNDVFAFMAIIEFIDNELILYEGDITVVK